MRRLSALAGPAERVEVGAPSSTSASGPKRHSKKKKRKKKPKKLPDWVSLVYLQGCNIEAADTHSAAHSELQRLGPQRAQDHRGGAHAPS